MLNEVQKARETELEQLLAACDIMLDTDCRLDGQPLTDKEYEQLWRNIKRYENELNKLKIKKFHLPAEKEEQKKENAAYVFFLDDIDNDGGMIDEFNMRHRSKNDGLEM